MEREASTCLLKGLLVTLWEGTQKYSGTKTKLRYVTLSCATVE